MRSLLFLILASFEQRISGDSGNVTEQRQIASSLRLENNFGRAQDETTITTAISVADEKFDDNELRESKEGIFKEKEQNENVIVVMSPQRKFRDLNTISHQKIECLSCFANGTLEADKKCYNGISVPSIQCAEAEHCYTQLHPLYIKRGCILPGRLNRTFVCKCPLCNDKPSFDSSHFEYKKISDWEFDNRRLQKPLVGVDITSICKICETNDGLSVAMSNICKSGKKADYMACGSNQLCFTNMNGENANVSRGCIDKPAYNSIYFFCNETRCNNDKLFNSKFEGYQFYNKFPVPKIKLVKQSFGVQLSYNATLIIVCLIIILS